MYISLNKKNYNYTLNKFQSIYSIKQDINKKYLTNVKLSQIILIYNNQILEDNKTPYDYKIKNTDTINIKLKEIGGGPTASDIGLLILSIFMTLFLIIFIILGVLPFLSFIFSKIFIKGFTLVLDGLRSLTSVNNFLNSFLATTKSVVLPIISFIFYYFGILIVIFYIVFFSTYYIYNFIYHDCRAFKASKALAMLTVMVLIMFYVMFNLPKIIKNIANTILPSFISGFISKICDIMNNFRFTLLGAIPYVGQFLTTFINVMVMGFDLLNKSKFYGPKFLYEWDKMYKYTLSPNVNKELRESKLRIFVNGLHQADKYENGKVIADIPFSNIEFTAFIFARFLFQTLVYVFIRFVEIFDICGEKPEALIKIEREMRETQDKMDEFQDALNNPDTEDNLRSSLRKGVQLMSKTLVKLSKNKEKEEKLKMLDIVCLKDILVNGALAGLPTVLLFLVIFILLCIPPMVDKIAK